VTVQRLAGEALRLDVAADETVGALRARLAAAWGRRPVWQVRLAAGTGVPRDSQRVLDVGAVLTAVLQVACEACGSRLDLPGKWPDTGSAGEEEPYASVALSLCSRRGCLHGRGARWLWEARLADGPAADGYWSGDDGEINYFFELPSSSSSNSSSPGEEREEAGDAQEQDEEQDEGDSDSDSVGGCRRGAERPPRKRARTGRPDRSYRRSVSGTRRSARCSTCLAETTMLSLMTETCSGRGFFDGIDSAFPCLQRLVLHLVGQEPNVPPCLAPVSRLGSLKMLDLWLPDADDEGQLQELSSLASLTHLYILGLRRVRVASLKAALEPLTKLEVLQVELEELDSDGSVETSLNLSRSTALRRLCLEGAIWIEELRPSRPCLILPAQVRDAAIPFTWSWDEECRREFEGLRRYYRQKGLHIADDRQAWAEEKVQARDAVCSRLVF